MLYNIFEFCCEFAEILTNMCGPTLCWHSTGPWSCAMRHSIARDHDPAPCGIARDIICIYRICTVCRSCAMLCRIALDLYPALYRIARDPNGIALDQLIKLLSHGVWLIGTIYKLGYLTKNFGPSLFGNRHSAGPNFTVEYLGEFETEFENILWCQSWA
jgi:hypothetical protein